MEYVAATLEGIEDICANEVKGKKLCRGRVLFTKIKEEYRSVNTVFELLKKFKFKEMEEIAEKVRDIKFPSKFTYKVSCKRSGKHNFKSVDVEKLVGEVLHNKEVPINIKCPEKIIYIDIIDGVCLVGMLLQDRICKRKYRVKINNQGINACLAFALLNILKYKKEETLLDPFCKDGVIAIEATVLSGKKVYASDPQKNNVRNAMINIKMAKCGIEADCHEIRELETVYKEKGIDKIATCIILSQKDKKSSERMKEFFYQVKSIVKSEIGIVTNKKHMKEYAKENFMVKEERVIGIGKAIYYLVILKRKGHSTSKPGHTPVSGFSN